MARIMLFGGRGYLGQHFSRAYPEAVLCPADISDRAAVRAYLIAYQPDIVLNCAGKTGRPNVDWCELHRPETLRANVTGPLVLLEECLARGARLVHLGSGCIYTGDNGGKGWSEDDPPNFFGSFYSRTKAWSDQVLRDFPVLNLRLRMPFDGTSSERSLIIKLRNYTRVLTERNSLTCIPDLVSAATRLIADGAVGTFNIVNPGPMSPYEVMTRYRALVDPTHRFEPLPASQLGEVATTGRSNCVLNTDKLRAAGIVLPTAEEAVNRCLMQLAGRASMRRSA
jgi:dTDP-4-dehydrorhamnose reductase